jgi:4-amino-4-deoxy-L-arabinose transferase-like glycosyltransferase
MSPRTFVAGVGIVALVSAIAVASTHRTFAQVIDEPVHIGAGHEYLRTGRYGYDIEHPPLARVLAALPLWLSDRSAPPPGSDWVQAGNQILLRGSYEQNLSRARKGNLLFLIVAVFATASWWYDDGRPRAGLLSAALFASLPPILGHAGVATTDMAAVATVIAAAIALRRWLADPSTARTLVLGAAIGLGLVSKFSFIVFFAVAGILVAVTANKAALRGRTLILKCASVAVIALGIVWAAYGFDVGTLEASRPGVALSRSLANVPIPAPLFAAGLLEVRLHDLRGHPSYLFGRQSDRGWWYYFPVAIFFKTPLSFLALFAIGCATRDRPVLLPLLVAAGMLTVLMAASINIGLRHALPIFPFLAIVAGHGVDRLLAGSRTVAIIASVLLASLLLEVVTAYPDCIAWFNMTARNPGSILIDSNLDWGQDILRLRAFLRAEHAKEVNTQLFTSADLDALGFPPRHPVDAVTPMHGWVALSETSLRVAEAHGVRFPWAVPLPFRWIGKSIRVYYVP